MANLRGPLNSADPTTSILVGGVYNEVFPAPEDQQSCALQLDNEGNLLVNVAVGGSGGTVKIEDSSGNPLDSNGSGALQVAVVSGGGSNDSVGATGTTAPTSATEVGIIVGGNLVGISSSNPVPASQGTAAVNTAGWPVTAGGTAESTAAWTNATSGNTAVQVNCAGMTTAVVTLNQGSTLTGGTVTFEVSDTTAFTNAFPISGQVPNPSSVNLVGVFNFITNTKSAFIFNVSGWAAFRIRLSTTISGTGTVNVGVTLSSASNPTATSTTAYITGTASAFTVISSLNNVIVADNNTGNSTFSNTNGSANPLATGSFVYGGAFSGAASSTKQGWSKSRTPTVFNTVQATASGNTAVWTPGSGNKFRLLKLLVQVTANASLASGGVLTISFQDSSTSINITFDVFVPTTAVTTAIGDGLDQELDLGGFGILSAAANNVLNVNLSSALATGNVRVIAMGTEE